MDAQAKLEQRAGVLMAQYRVAYLRQVFVLGAMARARAAQEFEELEALQAQLAELKADIAQYTRRLFSLRSQMIRLRMARAGHTPTNCGPVPDRMPEGEL